MVILNCVIWWLIFWFITSTQNLMLWGMGTKIAYIIICLLGVNHINENG